MNLDKFAVGLYYLRIFSTLENFQENQKLITMLSIKCLKFKFYSLRLCIEDGFMD